MLWKDKNKPVEFGAKLSVSLTRDGIACIDELRWDGFHEGKDLKTQVEAYKERHGVYPENGYGLNRIKAKTARTSQAWIRSIFLVMNLLVLYQYFLLPGIQGRYFGVLRRFVMKGLNIFALKEEHSRPGLVRQYCGG